MEAIFENTDYGKIAMAKLHPTAEGFMLYQAGWLGDKPSEWEVMELEGCVFREAKSGKNKGKRSIPVPGTKRKTYVTKAEIKAFKDAQ